mmetsp:Transcript_70115/g.182571  ORF Transcript_70115/g.182571 Transcript_70115/m.182571 type:complete len:220 (-) Transcript_70115:694-1353(-)
MRCGSYMSGPGTRLASCTNLTAKLAWLAGNAARTRAIDPAATQRTLRRSLCAIFALWRAEVKRLPTSRRLVAIKHVRLLSKEAGPWNTVRIVCARTLLGMDTAMRVPACEAPVASGVVIARHARKLRSEMLIMILRALLQHLLVPWMRVLVTMNSILDLSTPCSKAARVLKPRRLRHWRRRNALVDQLGLVWAWKVARHQAFVHIELLRLEGDEDHLIQ